MKSLVKHTDRNQLIFYLSFKKCKLVGKPIECVKKHSVIPQIQRCHLRDYRIMKLPGGYVVVKGLVTHTFIVNAITNKLCCCATDLKVLRVFTVTSHLLECSGTSWCHQFWPYSDIQLGKVYIVVIVPPVGDSLYSVHSALTDLTEHVHMQVLFFRVQSILMKKLLPWI